MIMNLLSNNLRVEATDLLRSRDGDRERERE